MVPLDRGLVSSYRLSIISDLAAICNASISRTYRTFNLYRKLCK